MAVDAARHLRRPGALPADLLEPVPRDVLRRRRREARRGRLPLAARPGRRRDERGRPPDQDDRGRDRRSSTTRPWPRRPSSARPTRSPARRSSRSSSCAPGTSPPDALGVQLREHVAYVIGPIARPKYLLFTPDLPKTRSGKIMRRLLRDIAEGRSLGDTTTLADATVVDDDPRQDRHRRRRTDVPFDFLKKGKPQPAPADPPTSRRGARSGQRDAGGDRPGIAFDGLTEEWRLVGRDGDRRPARRTSSTGASRSRSATSTGRRSTGRRRSPRRRACEAIDPYDLIVVLAGETTLPAMSDDEKAAHRIHKVQLRRVARGRRRSGWSGPSTSSRAPSRSGCSTGRPRCSCR